MTNSTATADRPARMRALLPDRRAAGWNPQRSGAAASSRRGVA
ncbi:hypothetical protein [Amnibacterium kyonggiense]